MRDDPSASERPVNEGGTRNARTDLHRRRFLRAATAGLGATTSGGAATATGKDSVDASDGSDSGAGVDGADASRDADLADDTTLVSDAADLRAIAEDPAGHYELAADVDASETETWNGSAGFEPIEEFTGTLDGGGHEIRGLTIDRPDTTDVGLFASLEGTVRDLELVDAEVRGENQVGAIAGASYAATIEDVTVSALVRGDNAVGGVVGLCTMQTLDPASGETTDCAADCDVRGDRYVGGLLGWVRATSGARVDVVDCTASGKVVGNDDVGGLVGEADDYSDPWGGSSAARIEHCSADADVATADDPGNTVGGLVGQLENVPVRNCSASGTVDGSGAGRVGGLVGEARDPVGEVVTSFASGDVQGVSQVGGLVGHVVHEGVRRCFAAGDVHGERLVGGLVGAIGNSSVTDVYALGETTGEEGIGGVAGQHRRGSELSRALALGPIDGDADVGAIVGSVGDGSSVGDSYWDVEATGRTTDAARTEWAGLETDQLQGRDATEHLDSFDFQSVWRTVPDEYPELRDLGDEEGGETAVSMEALRLVQTVEHTRVVDEDAQGSFATHELPVSERLIPDESEDRLAWTAPDPELVTDRLTAPVFDLRAEEPDAIAQPVEVVGRLRYDGETIVEERASLDPAVVAGTDAQRRDDLEYAGLEPPEQLPTLETLADAPERVSGAYPRLPVLPGAEYEVEVDGENLEEPVVQRRSIGEDEPVQVPRPTIGVVGVEGTELPTGSFSFDDEPDLRSFADEIADHLLETFPVSSLDVVVVDELAFVRGVMAEAEVQGAAEDALSDATTDLDAEGVHAVRHVTGGHQLTDVDVGAPDVTIGVVPRNEYLGEGTKGALTVLDGKPLNDAVLVEYDRVATAAHELGHYFLGGEVYDGTGRPAVDGGAHVSADVASTGYRLQGEHFEVLPGREPLMAPSGSELWPDAHMYQSLIDGEFDADTTSMPRGFLGELVGSVRSLRFTDEALADLEEEPGLDSADVGPVREELETVEAELRPLVDTADHRFQLPDLPDDAVREDLVAVGQSLETLGSDLDGRTGLVSNPYSGAGTTVPAVGRWLQHVGSALADAADGLSENAIEWVLRAEGAIRDGEPDVDVEVVPVVGEPTPVDGDGSMTVRDASGDRLADAPAADEYEVVTAEGDHESVGDVAIGHVPVPAAAATVELAVSDADGETVSTAIDPITDPIRTRIEALPDEAFEDSADRVSLLDELDTASEQVAAGDRDAAVTTLEAVRADLLSALRDSYEAGADDPEPSALAARLDGQADRVSGVGETGDGWGLSTNWILGGGLGIGGLSAGYLTYRTFGGDGAEPSDDTE